MKSEVFNNELEYIIDENIKSFTKKALDNLPDYFYEVAASSTGKYHPTYALGVGGLVRHTKAAVRFAHHLLQLEQNQLIFTEKERDMIISALLLHDGWKHGDKGGSFTTHEHPQICADWIEQNPIFNSILPKNERQIIAFSVSSHMGQWNENKRSALVLHKPTNEIQKFVHMCDYLASRKDIEIIFENEDEHIKAEDQDINTYKLTFGKHKNELIVDVAKTHLDYLQWMRDNMSLKEPLKSFVLSLTK